MQPISVVGLIWFGIQHFLGNAFIFLMTGKKTVPMIREDLGEKRPHSDTRLVLANTYEPRPFQPCAVLQSLSPVAQQIFYERCPHARGRYISSQQPEIIALRLLDFLSSKQGYIRRKGHTFRHAAFYRQMLPQLIKSIAADRPLLLSSLCLCTTLANTKYGGESPYPHMASYIALENCHKIAAAARKIYPHLRFVLGYEGNLFRPLYFHSEPVARNALLILRELNDIAYRQSGAEESANPIQIVDATWMIEQTFGTHAAFLEQVERKKQSIDPATLTPWQDWYRKTVSKQYFPSLEAREAFILDKACWREAVHYFKYAGGNQGQGFMRFQENAIPFTVSGRHTDMLALQLVPKNSYLPHQRAIVYEPENACWRMMAYQDIQADNAQYAPRYVRNYLYPFYFEKLGKPIPRLFSESLVSDLRYTTRYAVSTN